jgi:hypothetical protein
VEYLGHVISQEGVSTNSEKIQVVIDWLEPNSVKQLSGFLGLIGYYKWFVKGYEPISKALTQPSKKDAFTWNEESAGFQMPKKSHNWTFNLALHDLIKFFMIEIDALGVGIEAVLM